jgi:SAM-dependent methyltransferase
MSEKPRRKSSRAGVEETEVRKAVRKHYTELATKGTSCCGSGENTMCGCSDIYPQAELLSLPADAMAVSAGCGNPTAIASLKKGMTVVDLGSGGGIDVFLAAKKIGPKGKAIGIDMTPEMIYRARGTASENGYKNAEFRLGEIEHIPVESSTADVVISNCVINLSPDKDQVFREAFRVLKPGGKLAVSDIVLLKELPKALRNDLSAWSSCFSGALLEREYLGAMKRAGFVGIKVEDRAVYTHEQLRDYVSSEGQGKDHGDLSDTVASYRVTASKPR